MKYLVMECHPSYAIVLDESGRFLKVANMRYQVGQTVTGVIEMRVPTRTKEKTTTSKPRSVKRWLYTLTAAAACLVLVILAVFQIGNSPYGSVYLTINPEVRIDVNRQDRVVGLTGMNADGEELIRDYRHNGKNLDLVTDELVDLAIEKGYLHEGGQITLTLSGKDNEWVVTRGDTLSHQLGEYLTEKITVTIEVTPPRTDETAASGQSVIIPVEPSTNYDESDYGETLAPTQSEAPPDPTENPGYGQGDNHTPTEDSRTDYGEPTSPDDDGQSDYRESTAPVDTGQSDDGEPTSPGSDDGQSNYGGDDGQSNYGDDDGQSNYSGED